MCLISVEVVFREGMGVYRWGNVPLAPPHTHTHTHAHGFAPVYSQFMLNIVQVGGNIGEHGKITVSGRS